MEQLEKKGKGRDKRSTPKHKCRLGEMDQLEKKGRGRDTRSTPELKCRLVEMIIFIESYWTN